MNTLTLSKLDDFGLEMMEVVARRMEWLTVTELKEMANSEPSNEMAQIVRAFAIAQLEVMTELED